METNRLHFYWPSLLRMHRTGPRIFDSNHARPAHENVRSCRRTIPKMVFRLYCQRWARRGLADIAHLSSSASKSGTDRVAQLLRHETVRFTGPENSLLGENTLVTTLSCNHQPRLTGHCAIVRSSLRNAIIRIMRRGGKAKPFDQHSPHGARVLASVIVALLREILAQI